MKTSTLNRMVLVVVVILVAGTALADVFNMGSSLTSLEMVPVGDPGNAADTTMRSDGTTGYGAVNYIFNMGKYEVTSGQYTAFLNAVAADDTYGLYNTGMGTASSAGGTVNIQRTGMPGYYKYSVPADWANRPVGAVNFWNAARFCNWLQNGQPTGTQNSLTTEDGAYTLTAAKMANNTVTRNASATWFIPNENEWYKAAYYNGSGVNSGYWLYPTKSNSMPINTLLNPDPGNHANFFDYARMGNNGYTASPYYVTEVGSFNNSSSAYGTYDQAGNVWEWNESLVSRTERGLLGGSYMYGGEGSVSYLASTFRYKYPPSIPNYGCGFRIASVPEPGSILLLVSGAVAGMIYWRKCRKTV